MRSTALVIALVAMLIVPAFAQKAEIEAVSAAWIDFFNKGDFAGVASLYTEDATAFPPGQITEAFPWDSAPKYLIRDNDRAFGVAFKARVRALGSGTGPRHTARPGKMAMLN